MTATFAESRSQIVSDANGVDYAYRGTGSGTPSLVLFQHFRGNLDNWDPALIDAIATKGVLKVIYAPSAASQQAGREAFARMLAHAGDRDRPSSWQTRQAQYDAVCQWCIPDHAALERVGAIRVPVFVTNGDSDP